MMRICVLTDEEIQDFDPTPYLNGFDWEMVTMTDPVMGVLRELDARHEFDVYLNLCEGYENDADADWDYQGIDVVKALKNLTCHSLERIQDSLIRHAKKCKPR